MNNPKQIVAIVLIVAGVLALVYRGFTYTKETHSADIPIIGTVQVKEKERVDLPTWSGVAAIVIGGGLLLVPGRRSV
jgi:hypothetical protein